MKSQEIIMLVEELLIERIHSHRTSALLDNQNTRKRISPPMSLGLTCVCKAVLEGLSERSKVTNLNCLRYIQLEYIRRIYPGGGLIRGTKKSCEKTV